jgi:hypothetical protein
MNKQKSAHCCEIYMPVKVAITIFHCCSVILGIESISCDPCVVLLAAVIKLWNLNDIFGSFCAYPSPVFFFCDLSFPGEIGNQLIVV